MNVGLCGLLAFLQMWVLWAEVNPKAIVFFVMNMTVCEVFLQIRWRLSLVCPHCQFDPLLYLKSPEKAAARIRQHFEKLQDSPKYLLGYHPLQRLRAERRKYAVKKHQDKLRPTL